MSASPGRLSGNQIVVLALAACLALVLAPTIGYAAKSQLVSIADAKKPNRTAAVDKQGRLRAVVTGTVTTPVQPPPPPRPPAAPFHRERVIDGASSGPIGGPVPRGSSIAITSVSAVATTSGSGWSVISWRKAVGGVCSASGQELQRVANFRLDAAASGANANYVMTFPTPQVQRASDTPLCLYLVAAPGLAVIVDGYLF